MRDAGSALGMRCRSQAVRDAALSYLGPAGATRAWGDGAPAG